MSDASSHYLEPVDDGLKMRPNKSHALYKFHALQTYLEIAYTAMSKLPWRARYYIDLQAGPGKNVLGTQIELGSPLIALTTSHPPDQLRLNENDAECNAALRQRIAASALADRCTVYQKDVNEVVGEICDELNRHDRQYLPGKNPTFNIAFLDPEGLELEWSTVEALAQINRMDLIINFSTSGVLRSLGAGHYDKLDRFFGTPEWRNLPNPSRQSYIEFYLNRLKPFGYFIQIDPEFYHRDSVIQVNNSKNSEIYSLIFASKHPLGEKFWRQSAKSTKPPRLPGF